MDTPSAVVTVAFVMHMLTTAAAVKRVYCSFQYSVDRIVCFSQVVVSQGPVELLPNKAELCLDFVAHLPSSYAYAGQQHTALP